MNCFDVLVQTRLLIIGGSTKLATVRFSFMHHKNMFLQSFFTVENTFALFTFHRRRLFSFMHFSDVPFKRITSCENFITLGAYSGLWFLPFMNPINVTLHLAFVIKCLGAELTMVLFSFMNHQNVIQHGLFGRKVFHTMRTWDWILCFKFSFNSLRFSLMREAD